MSEAGAESTSHAITAAKECRSLLQNLLQDKILQKVLLFEEQMCNDMRINAFMYVKILAMLFGRFSRNWTKITNRKHSNLMELMACTQERVLFVQSINLSCVATEQDRSQWYEPSSYLFNFFV